jgi:hypothetical protein
MSIKDEGSMTTGAKWRVHKLPENWDDPDNQWTVTFGSGDDWETLDQNSDAATIEGGQFPSQEFAMKAAWEAIASWRGEA